MRGPAALALALVIALVSGSAGTALAVPAGPFGHEGRWITDAEGRVVVLHGVNLVAKGAPHLPSERGFGADDADLLASEGFNSVRLGVDYAAIEPEPGKYDERFIDAYAAELSTLTRRGIFPLADLHQDLFGDRYGGNGLPDWMAVDHGLPNVDFGFPLNYPLNAAMNRAFDNFWENAEAPDGVPLQSHYAEGLRRLGARLERLDGLLGYDIFNEPWAGSRYPTCVSFVLEGCPPAIGFDQTLLTAFSRRMIDAVRDSDGDHLVFYEPNLLFDFGAKTGHGDPQDPAAGFSFHNYCLSLLIAESGGDAPSSDSADGPCGVEEGHTFSNAEQHSAQTGSALLMTEFGATSDLRAIERMVEAADRNRVGWHYWSYASLVAGGQVAQETSVIRDLSTPPGPDNLNQPHLEVLVRPYPRVIAGTPESWEFDREAKRFSLSYSTRGPGGKDFASTTSPVGLETTEIFVPARHFASGHRVTVRGAEVLHDRGQLLVLRNCRGARRVQIEITAGQQTTTGGCESDDG